MDGDDRVHCVFFFPEHQFQFVIPDNIVQRPNLFGYFIYESLVLFLNGERDQGVQVVQRRCAVSPQQDSIFQLAFFLQGFFGLVLIIPKTVLECSFLKGFYLIFDFLEVKDTPLYDLFFFLNRLLG
jgi:hypothetical protein